MTIRQRSVSVLAGLLGLAAALPAGGAQAQQLQQLAALAPRSSSDTCLQREATDPARRIAACTAAIGAGALAGRDLVTGTLNRAQAYAALGDRAQAAADERSVVRQLSALMDPQVPDPNLLLLRATTYHALGQAEPALADYNLAIRLSPTSALPFIDRGILLVDYEQKYELAKMDFDRALVLAPGNVAALAYRGEAYGKMGDVGRGIADLDHAIELAPQQAQAFLFRGVINGQRGELKQAIADYSQAIKLAPQYVDALVDRASVYARLDDNDQAMADLDAALAIQPTNALALYNRGYVHFVRQEYDPALADYSAALSADPNMTVAYTNRCLVRGIIGRQLTEALDDCNMALKAAPQAADAHETKGFVYLKMGNPDGALTEYNAALDIAANRPLALYGRSLALKMKGDVSQANADSTAARKLDPAVDSAFSKYGLP